MWQDELDAVSLASTPQSPFVDELANLESSSDHDVIAASHELDALSDASSGSIACSHHSQVFDNHALVPFEPVDSSSAPSPDWAEHFALAQPGARRLANDQLDPHTLNLCKYMLRDKTSQCSTVVDAERSDVSRKSFSQGRLALAAAVIKYDRLCWASMERKIVKGPPSHWNIEYKLLVYFEFAMYDGVDLKKVKLGGHVPGTAPAHTGDIVPASCDVAPQDALPASDIDLRELVLHHKAAKVLHSRAKVVYSTRMEAYFV
jgi:hypothetical protein